MFCRFCGARILEDSLFCSKCGKRLAGDRRSGSDTGGWRVRLKSPYPWAVLLFLAFVVWTVRPDSPGVDPSALALELELEGESSVADANVFRHYLSLVVENRGSGPVGEIPVEFQASIVPDQDAEVVSEFRGGRFVVLRNGQSLPLILILDDEIAPSEKRRFPIDSIVTTAPPAEVTYTVRSEASGEVLASLSAPVKR